MNVSPGMTMNLLLCPCSSRHDISASDVMCLRHWTINSWWDYEIHKNYVTGVGASNHGNEMRHCLLTSVWAVSIIIKDTLMHVLLCNDFCLYCESLYRINYTCISGPGPSYDKVCCFLAGYRFCIKFMFDMNNELRLKLNETSQLKVF